MSEYVKKSCDKMTQIIEAHEKTIKARDNLIERMMENIRGSEIEITEIENRHHLEIDQLESEKLPETERNLQNEFINKIMVRGKTRSKS